MSWILRLLIVACDVAWKFIEQKKRKPIQSWRSVHPHLGTEIAAQSDATTGHESLKFCLQGNNIATRH